MELRIENVTPHKAQAWLNENKSNRKLRDGIAEKYAADMSLGRWTTCPVPISFYEDGDVADGQHRLWAVVDSGMAQKFPVARGLTREDGLNIDTGLGRSLVDNARISGTDTGLSNELISVARAIHEGTQTRKPASNAQRMEWIGAHRDAATWACSNGPRGRGLRNAVVLTAVARAWYHETDHEKLRRFCDVITSGHCDGEAESAAVTLRNYLMVKGPTASSSALWIDTFLKIQNAINYFMRCKKLMVIKAVSEEAYPLKKRRASK